MRSSATRLERRVSPTSKHSATTWQYFQIGPTARWPIELRSPQLGAAQWSRRPRVDVEALLIERTGPMKFDRRRNAGVGWGFEFWRILMRDIGASGHRSSSLRPTKIQVYLKRGRCMQPVAGGRSAGQMGGSRKRVVTSSGRRLLALRDFVPKSVTHLMATQVCP